MRKLFNTLELITLLLFTHPFKWKIEKERLKAEQKKLHEEREVKRMIRKETKRLSR